MSEIMIHLSRILPNPWQTRRPRPGDEVHIQELAADIRARGLLQPPLGRLVDQAGQPTSMPVEGLSTCVQLAFGHNRLAAFKLLAQEDPEQYGWMPVRLAGLDDQAMALAAWSENAARRDLTAVEQAQAIVAMMEHFGWSQAEVAERLQLAPATVSNKLRLLRLPQALLDQVASGEVSERQAMSLLPIYDLPPAARDKLEQMQATEHHRVWEYDKVARDLPGASSTAIRQGVDQAILAVTVPLAGDKGERGSPASFPVDERVPGVDAPACQDCPHRVRDTRCADPDCCARKQAAWEAGRCAFAVQATGIPFLSRAAFWEAGYPNRSQFGDYGDDPETLQRALAGHCPNLRLVYEGDRGQNTYPARVPDYPHVAYACVREKGPCSCAERGDRKAQLAAERAAQKEQEREARKVRETAVRELASAIERQELPALRAILVHMVRYTGEREKVLHIPDAGTIREKVAREILGSELNTYSAMAAEQSLATWRKKVGFEGVDIPAPTGATAPE